MVSISNITVTVVPKRNSFAPEETFDSVWKCFWLSQLGGGGASVTGIWWIEDI